jgi:HEAT repeat protein
MPPALRFCVLCFLCVLVSAAAAAQGAQEPGAPQPVAAADLQAAIDKLGDLDYETRTNASRTVRRTPAEQAVPALLRAVAEHRDGYVRYRALVLLTGFNDPRTFDAIRESLGSPNDRLRTVAYSYLERTPSRGMTTQLLAAMERELAEFVRPALVRALAASAGEPQIQSVLVRETTRGEDFFRSAVIEALGDYKAAYAFDALTKVAVLEGPLQDDAALALGKIGDKRALETLAGLQRTAPRPTQPTIAAAICLLGVNCDSHENYLVQTLRFADSNPGFQELLRGAAAGLAALGVAGRASALHALMQIGIPSRDPTRAPVALAVATIALRNTPAMLAFLEKNRQLGPATAGADRPVYDERPMLDLLAEGFDMLEEDLDKERFFALVRRTYWQSPEGSPTRAMMQTLIGELAF